MSPGGPSGISSVLGILEILKLGRLASASLCEELVSHEFEFIWIFSISDSEVPGTRDLSYVSQAVGVSPKYGFKQSTCTRVSLFSGIFRIIQWIDVGHSITLYVSAQPLDSFPRAIGRYQRHTYDPVLY